jgi:lysozyme
MSARAKAALSAGLGVVALATTVLIKPWEGRELHAYKDVVGIWTICDGETKGVKPGMVKTDAECDAMTEARVEKDFYIPLTKCIDGFTAAPIGVQATFLSAAYNLGTGTICRSTAARLLANGSPKAACHAMTRFNRAGGRVWEGLKKRREMGDKKRIGELEICLEALK